MIGTPNGPLHAGLLQAMTDGGFAAGFDDARTDEERLTAEVGITHPLRIALKVVQGTVNRFLSRLISGTQPLELAQDGFDVALIKLLAAASGPIVGLGGGLAVHALGQFGQMLAGMVEVDNLDGIVEVFIGNVLDPRCSIANDNDPPAALQAAAHRFSINAR